MIVASDVWQRDWMPDQMVHRGDEVAELSNMIEPAFSGGTPDHIVLAGPNGVGKTTLTRMVLGTSNTATTPSSAIIATGGRSTQSILSEVLRQFPADVHLDQQHSVQTQITELQNIVDKPYIVVLDDADEIQETEVLDALLQVTNTTLICVTRNCRRWQFQLNKQHQAQFSEDREIQLSPYSPEELVDILEQRAIRALDLECWSPTILKIIGHKAGGNAHVAIQTLKQTVEFAKRRGRTTLTRQDINDGYEQVRGQLTSSDS